MLGVNETLPEIMISDIRVYFANTTRCNTG